MFLFDDAVESIIHFYNLSTIYWYILYILQLRSFDLRFCFFNRNSKGCMMNIRFVCLDIARHSHVFYRHGDQNNVDYELSAPLWTSSSEYIYRIQVQYNDELKCRIAFEWHLWFIRLCTYLLIRLYFYANIKFGLWIEFSIDEYLWVYIYISTNH